MPSRLVLKDLQNSKLILTFLRVDGPATFTIEQHIETFFNRNINDGNVQVYVVQIQENNNRLILFCTFNRGANNIRNWGIMGIREPIQTKNKCIA